MLKSANLICKGKVFTHFSKVFVSTSGAECGKNPYTTPIRDIILSNEEMKNQIEHKRSLIGLADPNKDKVEIFYENRNPRHMELLGYNKPSGFTTLYESRNFYNKLHLNITNRHVKAFVENINGSIVCYASTTEYAIAKRLHNTTDVSAVVNIARILAERLKKTGLTRVHWFTRMDRTTEKMREFEGILINNGIILSELPVRVLEGPSQTLPPARPKRIIPSKLSRGVKNMGTINRKDKK